MTQRCLALRAGAGEPPAKVTPAPWPWSRGVAERANYSAQPPTLGFVSLRCPRGLMCPRSPLSSLLTALPTLTAEFNCCASPLSADQSALQSKGAQPGNHTA